MSWTRAANVFGHIILERTPRPFYCKPGSNLSVAARSFSWNLARPRLALAAMLLVFASNFTITQAAEPVDLELVLAVDVSGSIDAYEANLQRDGYLAAIVDSRVLAAIRSGRLGRIAATYLEWGSEQQQKILVPWTVIENEPTAAAFASALQAAPRSLVADRTSLSGAIGFALPMFANNEFDSPRQVIDISGDGPNNSGKPVDAARDIAVSAGVTINGLPVINDRPNRFGLPGIPDLDRYYAACVIGGPGSFLIVAKDFGDFAGAVLRKFILEIAAIPPPRQPAPTVFRMVADSKDPICGVGERRFQRYFGK